LGWGGFKAPQHVYQPRDRSSDPSLLSLLHLCESSSSNSVRTSAHVCARMLLGLLLMSALGCYLDSCLHMCLDSTQNSALAVLSIRLYLPLRNTHLPHCNLVLMYTNPTQSSMSICAMSSRNSTQMSAWASARTSVSQIVLQVRACAFGPRLDLCPCPCYNLNPCHPTLLGCPLGHSCLTPSYKFEPVPSGPVTMFFSQSNKAVCKLKEA
jgi:hypothetical protein